VSHDREVVGDKEVREVELLLKIFKQCDDLRLHGDVECRDGFVQDDELGTQRERAGDADPLALAAGELVWVPVVVLFPEPDGFK
jgi:hypothetical protein